MRRRILRRKRRRKERAEGGKGRFNTLVDGEASVEGEDEAPDDSTEESRAATATKLMAKLLPLTEGEKKTEKTYVFNEALMEMEEFELVGQEDDEQDDEEVEDPWHGWTQQEIDEANAAHEEFMYGPRVPQFPLEEAYAESFAASVTKGPDVGRIRDMHYVNNDGSVLCEVCGVNLPDDEKYEEHLDEETQGQERTEPRA